MLCNLKVCSEAIALVNECVGEENLCFAFIAGSRAKTTHTQASDVDLFVLLHNNCVEQELALFQGLAELHTKYGLLFEHCGQVLDLQTLDSIVTSAKRLDPLYSNGFTNLACYQADCFFSIARKAMVVLHMLFEEKRNAIGCLKTLEHYSAIANEFYETYGSPPHQQHVKEDIWQSSKTSQKNIRRFWDKVMGKVLIKDIQETPFGVNLVKWFGEPIKSDLGNVEFPIKQVNSQICPLTIPVKKPCNLNSHKSAVKSQCLGVIKHPSSTKDFSNEIRVSNDE